MANKLLLVPESIYRGLTSTDTGEPNLDFARKELENVKRQRIDSSRKNILYNQQLRRYLNLRNEREERPARVELTKGLRMLVKKGDEDDEIVLEQEPPNIPPKPEGTKKKRPQPEPDENKSVSSYASLPPADDFFMEERDEETRGKKRKNTDEPTFPPKRWPLQVPEPAFRESTKRKYFKAKSKPALRPTIRMGNPSTSAAINEEDEFGNSPPPSPLDWFDKRKEPELIQISSVGVRKDRKRKGEEPDDEGIGIKKPRIIPPLKTRPRPKPKILNMKKKPEASKELVLANRQQPSSDTTEALSAPLPSKSKRIPGEILIPSAEVRAERKRTLDLDEEGIPSKKFKRTFPPKQPTKIKKINWAKRKPTKGEMKINWAQRMPTRDEMNKINWAQRKPTREEMKRI